MPTPHHGHQGAGAVVNSQESSLWAKAKLQHHARCAEMVVGKHDEVTPEWRAGLRGSYYFFPICLFWDLWENKMVHKD